MRLPCQPELSPAVICALCGIKGVKQTRVFFRLGKLDVRAKEYSTHRILAGSGCC